MLAGALTDDGERLDHEYATDILDLACVRVGSKSAQVDERSFKPYLDARRAELEAEVQARNSKYYDQQEELLYRNGLDRKAESEAKIRDCHAKEKQHRQLARASDDPLEQLKHKKEARRWAERADEEYERSRAERMKLRDEADRFLELIEESLKGTQSTERLFTIRWRIEE